MVMVTLLIAAALSADAFAVSVVCGASDRTVRLRTGIFIAGIFGLFQCLMPVLGWSIGTVGSRAIDGFDHIVSFGILIFIGIQMIFDSRDGNQTYSFTELKTVFLMAAATSIDALTVGVALPSAAGVRTFSSLIITALTIGGITFLLCLAGFFAGKSAGRFRSSAVQAVGGLVLILIGIKALISG